MIFTERDLTVFEKFLNEITEAKKRDKRISSVSMTQAEYDDFYRQAMAESNIQVAQELMARKQIFGVAITIEEVAPKKKK